MTILNFFGGAEVGGDGPSYHCARLRFASNGLRPTPRAMRLKSRRFIGPSCNQKVDPANGEAPAEGTPEREGVAGASWHATASAFPRAAGAKPIITRFTLERQHP